MADVFMNWLLDNVNKIGCSPHIIYRYVNAIFCTFDSKEKMDQFFYNLNKVHSNVSFSKDVEADGQLAYLDDLLTKTETGIEATRLPTGKTLIQDSTINGKACRHYNIKRV